MVIKQDVRLEGYPDAIVTFQGSDMKSLDVQSIEWAKGGEVSDPETAEKMEDEAWLLVVNNTDWRDE